MPHMAPYRTLTFGQGFKIPDIRLCDRSEKMLNKALQTGLSVIVDEGSIEDALTR